MTLNVWFWAIYVLALIFGVAGVWYSAPPDRWRWGGWVVIWILVGILGWHDFGSPVKGG